MGAWAATQAMGIDRVRLKVADRGWELSRMELKDGTGRFATGCDNSARVQRAAVRRSITPGASSLRCAAERGATCRNATSSTSLLARLSATSNRTRIDRALIQLGLRQSPDERMRQHGRALRALMASFGPLRLIGLDSLIATKPHLMRIQDKFVPPQRQDIKERRQKR